MRVLLYIVISAALISAPVFSATPESIAEKNRNQMEDIKKRDQERRERIIRKFTDFQERVKNFAPGLKIKIPVDPSGAEDIVSLDYDSKMTSAEKGFKAYAADSYKLRSLPYDSDREYTGSVKRGDTLTVLMKPVVEKRKEMPSITKDWLLVRTSDGTEGYMPQNMVLGKKPSKSSIKENPYPDEEEIMLSAIKDTEYGLLLTSGTDLFMAQKRNLKVRGSADGLTKMRVNTATLKVRSEPSLEAEVTGYLNKNDEVTVEVYSSNEDTYQGRTSKWAKINSSGISGWVFAIYLSEMSGDGSSGDAKSNGPAAYLSKGKELYVKPDILRVRDAPDDMGTVLFSLQNKDEVRITDVEEEAVTLGGKRSIWVKIKYLDYEGWVFGAFLSDSKNAYEEGDDINSIFQVPITDNNYFISSKFGKRILKGQVSNHTGIDLAAECGTPVSASADGVVILTVSDSRNCSSCSYGSYIIIEHKNGYRTVYGHLSEVKATVGQKVTSGQKIGAVGNTGHSYGCHLHFEIRAYEEFIDPMNYIHP